MIVCGIDEAGRGSFVGPMVIAGVAVPDSAATRLRDEGVRDSKALGPRARERLYRTVMDAAAGHMVVMVHPRAIDDSVLVHGLTDLELDRMAGIISGVRADAYYVDSCYANPALFEAKLRELTGDRPVRSYTKADARFTVVAAASIVAKVVRDRAVSCIRRAYQVGSGYPSDRRVVECVEREYRATGAFPGFVRRSWYTTCRIAGDQRAALPAGPPAGHGTGARAA